ncbi:PfkB family carbohydrate kinase [uncultured Desulfosarcina sp.]|uniref:PfkB family carbohydrate kinase n=1 Tax=uncultured Desulfosarcina sp. TaxID=218289 RepID=UPI0029C887C3|nr:PfkB family carbohydrate kinase [uncultured Desulfosarcina sp.]
MVRELGGQSVALGLVGGYDGLQLEGFLINAGVMTDFTRISGETRTNIILRERAKGRQYAISATGPEIKATEINMFFQHVNQVRDMDYLILSGSLPRGVSPNLYGQLILAGKKRGFSSFWMPTAGTATAQTPGTELCHLADVEAILPRVELSKVYLRGVGRHHCR